MRNSGSQLFKLLKTKQMLNNNFATLRVIWENLKTTNYVPSFKQITLESDDLRKHPDEHSLYVFLQISKACKLFEPAYKNF